MNPATMIYELYEQTNEERERSQSHYPSGLCAIKKGVFIGKCRRATAYELLGYEKSDPIDGISLFKMDIGNVLHKMLNEKIDESLKKFGGGESVGEEVSVKWKENGLALPFSGRIDKIIAMVGPEPDDNFILGSEWKTTYGRGVSDIQKNGPKEDALLQVIAYLRQKEIKIDQYLLSYLAKDSGYIYSFLFYHEGKDLMMLWLNSGAMSKIDWSWTHIKAALVPLEEAVASGKLPDGDYKAPTKSKATWRCNYCSYAKTCYAEE